jgi:hypothetical protein
MADIVREMMKQQHKAMYIALRDGKFDPVAEGSADASQATRAVVAESPPSVSPPALTASLAPTPAPGAVAAPRPPSLTPPPGDRTDPGVPDVEAPATIRQPPPAAAELTLDIDALERAAAANAASPVLRAASDLPPPPANLFREKTTSGKYRLTPVPPEAGKTPSVLPRPPTTGATPPVRRPVQAATAAERRYAPTRPAAIFGQGRPQQGKSIFGEDLISDKSLDEVILSYLAEDLDEKK